MVKCIIEITKNQTYETIVRWSQRAWRLLLVYDLKRFGLLQERPAGEYCLHPSKPELQPIGVVTQKFVDYADYVDSHGMVFNIGSRKLRNVWDEESSEVCLYVHDDSIPVSW